MLHLIAAVITTVVLAVSSPSVKNGEDFTATAKVSGAYSGSVCVLVGNDEAQQVVGEVCYPELVEVKEGETKDVSITLTVPASAAKGAYSIIVVLPTDDEDITSNVEHFTVVE